MHQYQILSSGRPTHLDLPVMMGVLRPDRAQLSIP
jgi:hypothetical protein